MTPAEAMRLINERQTAFYAVARTYQPNATNLAQPKVSEGPMLFVRAHPLVWAAEETIANRMTVIVFFAEIDYLVLNVLRSMGLPCLAVGETHTNVDVDSSRHEPSGDS